MGGWICGESDLDYPKIGIEIVRINLREIDWNDVLGYLDPYQHASLLMPIKSWGGNPYLMNHTLINMVLSAYRAK